MSVDAQARRREWPRSAEHAEGVVSRKAINESTMVRLPWVRPVVFCRLSDRMHEPNPFVGDTHAGNVRSSRWRRGSIADRVAGRRSRFRGARAKQRHLQHFESLERNNATFNGVGGSYGEDGFRIDQGAGEPNPLSVFGTQSSRYLGSTALFNDTPRGLVTLTNIGGGAFDLLGIDLGELNGSSLGSVVASVTFDGVLALGGSVKQTFTLDGKFGMQTFSFGSLFSDVASVSWRLALPDNQFDNIVVDEMAPVPVPAAFGMLALGLGGLGLMRRRKG